MTTLDFASIDSTAATAHYVCGEYLDNLKPYTDARAAVTAFNEACHKAEAELRSRRPAGKLAQDHPWHVELRELSDHLRISRGLVYAIANRADAKARGKLREYDDATERKLNAESKGFARAADEIDRRENRLGRPLPTETCEAIVKAYTAKG